MSRTEQTPVCQQRRAFTTLCRATGLGAIALMLSGCSASQHVSEGAPAIENSALSEPLPFTRLAPSVYTPEEWPQSLTADVYLPDEPSGALRPAALVVHGGGWRNRTPEDMQGIAEQLAGQGYVAVNIEYRFAPQYRFPSQLHDLQQAMTWIHAHADEWQVDTSRIVGVGFSSGAHLVSLLAVAGAEGPLSEPYGGEQSRLAAVLAGGLPSDLLKFDDGRLVVDFIGGTRAEENEAYRLASPARQITPQAPPFFLFHGKWDQLVPVDHATDLYQALQDNNIQSELYLQRWRGHITSFLLRGGAIDAGIAFLNRQVNP
ncbi:alpha/beta hydrolase [Vreelandella boliviensis]|uniref:Alpha/beta hydrolase n=1 Tax=Vreelandella boliviensis LC1 TaxID=1072583 RepID=A0ABX4GBP7_9GAMM|nr:alpha/beta hydrolase [Halomonas boliviensis]OZT75189.1 alpha/beta hydrolase [Halomonas boliviensis LC1]